MRRKVSVGHAFDQDEDISDYHRRDRHYHDHRGSFWCGSDQNYQSKQLAADAEASMYKDHSRRE